jgi:ribosomal-protein-alanine N-acetyltransferase
MLTRTERMDLHWATPADIDAALAGNAHLGTAVGATVPATWPPEFIDAPTLRWMRERLSATAPEDQRWWMAFLLLRPPESDSSDRVLVGTAGYKGPPSEAGVVEVGYSIVSEYQRRRLATEATAELVRSAFAVPRVTAVIAETLVDGTASQGVLRHCGFEGPEPGSEEGVVRFVRRRP